MTVFSTKPSVCKWRTWRWHKMKNYDRIFSCSFITSSYGVVRLHENGLFTFGMCKHLKYPIWLKKTHFRGKLLHIQPVVCTWTLSYIHLFRRWLWLFPYLLLYLLWLLYIQCEFLSRQTISFENFGLLSMNGSLSQFTFLLVPNLMVHGLHFFPKRT